MQQRYLQLRGLLTTTPELIQCTIQRVYSGSYALKLGSQLAQSRAERAVYTVPITNNNKIFRYNYAVVLEIRLILND